MNSSTRLSWSQITRWRGECGKRFGTIRDLPVRSPDEVLYELLKPNSRVLDVGAGVLKSLKQSINLPTQKYFSLDNDTEGGFDFRSFDDVPENARFDLMVAHQVLEHLTINETFEILCSAEKHLEVGGFFLASVPNMAHPVRYWADASHVTAWSFNDLYSVFRNAEFYVYAMARYNKHALPHNPIKRYIVDTVCEVFRVDWCDSLMIVGQKKKRDS